MTDEKGEKNEVPARPWFKDAAGRRWELVIDPWVMKRVRALTGVNLGVLLNDNMKPFKELVADPVLFVDVLWVLCEQQAKEKGVSDEEFGRSLAGDPLEEAGLAFEAAYLLFCPSRTREILTPLMAKARAAVEATTAEFKKRVEALDLTAITTPSPSNAPESSESIPAG